MVFFPLVILLPEVVPVVPELVTVLPDVLDVTLVLDVTVVDESGGSVDIVPTVKACWLGDKAPETTVRRTSVP